MSLLYYLYGTSQPLTEVVPQEDYYNEAGIAIVGLATCFVIVFLVDKYILKSNEE
jgi:hypothetical protein